MIHVLAFFIRWFQALLSSTKTLSSTWNFPDNTIKKALLLLIKREDCDWALQRLYSIIVFSFQLLASGFFIILLDK